MSKVAELVFAVYVLETVPYETFEFELSFVVQETVAVVAAVVEAIALILGAVLSMVTVAAVEVA